MTTKRVLEEFSLDEISAVDRPAQKHARMAIMKRDAEQEQPMAFENFDEAVAVVRKRLNLSNTDAMRRVADEHPELLEKCRYAQPARPFQKAEPPEAIRKFQARVEEIELAKECSRTEAMQEAQRRHPDEFAAYQAA